MGDQGLHTVLYQRNNLIDNLKYYLSHSDTSIYLSYSYYDKVNLKDMTEGVRLVTSENVQPIETNLYFFEDGKLQFKNTLSISNQEEAISFDNGVVNEIETAKPREAKEPEENKIPQPTQQVVRTLSPSDVQNLIECPFRFYYQKVCGIPSVEFPKLDETTWLEANTKGTMFHEVMEFYFNNFLNESITSFDKDAFDKAFADALENAIKINPINNVYIQKKEVEFLKGAAEAYLKRIIEEDQIFNKYHVLKCEYDLKELNLFYKKNDKEYFKFTGVIDRIDGYVEDRVLHLRLFDYKTGKRKTKGTNPYYQHILYSYVLDKALEKNQFELEYDEVVIDEFDYSFCLDQEKGKKELPYLLDDIKEGSKDYDIVFDAIDGALLPFLDNEEDVLKKMNDVFVDEYPEPQEITKFYHGICGYCKYKKECLKRLEWGNKGW